jgi:hypothetical protein
MKRPQTGLRMIFLTVALIGAVLGWSLAIRDGLEQYRNRNTIRRFTLEKDIRDWEQLKRNSTWLGTNTSVGDFYISKLNAELKATE